MEYLKQHIEILKQDDLLKHVELCGKNCYKSESSITDSSAKRFIRRIEQNNHGSVLEHGGIYLKVDHNKVKNSCDFDSLSKILRSKYSTCWTSTGDNKVSSLYTNSRVIFDNYKELYDVIVSDLSLPDGLEYFTPADHDPDRRVTVRIITDRRIETEIVRHKQICVAI